MDKTKIKDETFLFDTLHGLSLPQKRILLKYGYDDNGSLLFEQICDLDEYYLTRTETAIVKKNVDDIADVIGPDAIIIEPGSGPGTKTKLLFKALRSPTAYAPIEISSDALERSTATLKEEFPDLSTYPVCADYFDDVELPRDLTSPTHRRVVYFFGNTMGNYESADRVELLQRFRRLVGGGGGGLLVGVDLQKEDTNVIYRAYNTSHLLSAFTKNFLKRINGELGADFNLEQFTHQAPYDATHHRIELRLYSDVEQTVSIAGRTFDVRFLPSHVGPPKQTLNKFACNEYIDLGCSHKFTVSAFSAEVESAGFKLKRVWTDEHQLYGVFYFQSDMMSGCSAEK